MAVNFEVDFVEVPDAVRLGPTSAQICGYFRPEVVHPTSYGLVRHNDLASRSSTSRKLRVKRA
jgi:hypothetical protein